MLKWILPQFCSRLSIFISYAREDEKVAHELATLLKMKGDRVFFDKESLEATSDFSSNIATAIRRSQRFVFLISPHSLEEGGFAQFELTQAKQRWENPTGVVLPVVLDDRLPIGELDPYLRLIQMVAPKGNVAHQVAHEIDRTRRTGLLCRAVIASLGLSSFVIGGTLAYDQLQKNTPYLTLLPVAGISHYVGAPNVIVSANMKNPTTRTLNLTNFRIQLSGPLNEPPDKRSTHELVMEGVVHRNAFSMAINHGLLRFPIEPEQRFTAEISFQYLDSGQGIRLQKAIEAGQRDPQLMAPTVRWSPTMIAVKPELASEIEQAARKLFVWRSGKWLAKISYTANQEQHSHQVKFDVTAEHVRKMKEIMPFYKSGAGIFQNWRFIGPPALSAVDLEFAEEPRQSWFGAIRMKLNHLSRHLFGSSI